MKQIRDKETAILYNIDRVRDRKRNTVEERKREKKREWDLEREREQWILNREWDQKLCHYLLAKLITFS